MSNRPKPCPQGQLHFPYDIVENGLSILIAEA